MLPIGKRQGNNIVNIEGKGAQSILVDLKEIFPNITYSVLFESQGSILLNLIMKDPWILDNIIETGIPLQYPIEIKNGMASIELITERNKVDMFLQKLEQREIKYTIKSIGRYQNFPLLTNTQKKMLTKAYNQGYFEIPRKISLTNLGRELNISASSMSETLRRIFKKLTKQYFQLVN
jgi:hypothetical protein